MSENAKAKAMMTERQKRKCERIEEALHHLAEHESDCRLCPRECRVDRKSGERGFCQTGNQASLSHAVLHWGEEPVLSGVHDCAGQAGKSVSFPTGSGALFFSGCNLKCLFCQNYHISWFNHGEKRDSDQLAGQMLSLQNQGALNINLVSPSHVLVPILKALQKAYARGFRLPLVYNSNGYEKAEIIRHLGGIVDIYLPDFKYYSPALSNSLSRAPHYSRFARASIQEMHRQRPVFICDNREIAQEGLIIRHLVLPGHWKDSIRILRWLAQHCREGIALSLMSQYTPCHKAPVSLQKTLEAAEYNIVVEKAVACGFETIFIQPESFREGEHRTPDFHRQDPFDWS